MIPEELDLRELTEELRAKVAPGEPVGYLRGKAYFRDVLVHEKGFSELEAEEVIDTLELQGFLRFQGDPAERSQAESHWDIRPHS
jgi:hypothetical protein